VYTAVGLSDESLLVGIASGDAAAAAVLVAGILRWQTADDRALAAPPASGITGRAA